MSQQMCSKCNKFFGNPQKLNMCSSCYKLHQQQEKLINEASTFKIPEASSPTSPKQMDQTHCFACKKKIGLLGVHCNHCDYFYCNLHRLLEDHNCPACHFQADKQVIKKKNPTVTAPKIEHF